MFVTGIGSAVRQLTDVCVGLGIGVGKKAGHGLNKRILPQNVKRAD